MYVCKVESFRVKRILGSKIKERTDLLWFKHRDLVELEHRKGKGIFVLYHDYDIWEFSVSLCRVCDKHLSDFNLSSQIYSSFVVDPRLGRGIEYYQAMVNRKLNYGFDYVVLGPAGELEIHICIA